MANLTASKKPYALEAEYLRLAAAGRLCREDRQAWQANEVPADHVVIRHMLIAGFIKPGVAFTATRAYWVLNPTAAGREALAAFDANAA